MKSLISTNGFSKNHSMILILFGVVLEVIQAAFLKDGVDMTSASYQGRQLANQYGVPHEVLTVNHDGTLAKQSVITKHEDGSFLQTHRVKIRKDKYEILAEAQTRYENLGRGGYRSSTAMNIENRGETPDWDGESGREIRKMLKSNIKTDSSGNVIVEEPPLTLKEFLDENPNIKSDSWKFIQFLEAKKHELGKDAKVDSSSEFSEKVLKEQFLAFKNGATNQLRLENPAPIHSLEYSVPETSKSPPKNGGLKDNDSSKINEEEVKSTEKHESVESESHNKASVPFQENAEQMEFRELLAVMRQRLGHSKKDLFEFNEWFKKRYAGLEEISKIEYDRKAAKTFWFSIYLDWLAEYKVDRLFSLGINPQREKAEILKRFTKSYKNLLADEAAFLLGAKKFEAKYFAEYFNRNEHLKDLLSSDVPLTLQKVKPIFEDWKNQPKTFAHKVHSFWKILKKYWKIMKNNLKEFPSTVKNGWGRAKSLSRFKKASAEAAESVAEEK